MLTKEILRIKGTVLYTIAPEGRVCGTRSARWSRTTSGRWW